MDLLSAVGIESHGDPLQGLVPTFWAELGRHYGRGPEAGIAAEYPGAGLFDEKAVGGQDVQTHLLEDILDINKIKNQSYSCINELTLSFAIITNLSKLVKIIGSLKN